MRPNKPFIKYLVSSPYGDIPVDKRKWHLPLDGDALKTPYKRYFYSIRDFLLRDELKPLFKAASKKHGREIQRKDINEILIRAEKHGILYHPASIELILKEGKIKFGLNVAITDTGRYWLKEEFSVLQYLNTKFNMPYLPKVYLFLEQDSISFLLEDWFDDYHEFHLSVDNTGKQKIKLWDFNKGYKYLSSEEGFEIYKQASKILTSYYDIKDFSQILGWHHAAGDFVAKIEDRKVDVRLTTARQYEPFIGFTDSNVLNPILALLYFFLNLSLKMRMDKLDGTGEVAWADDICLEATFTGFFEAMQSKKDLKSYLNFDVKDFLKLISSFNQRELKSIFIPLIEQYRNTSDYSVIMLNLDEHIERLITILQNFLQ
jgi:hypothetical protein